MHSLLKSCRVVSVGAAEYSNGFGHRDAYRYKPANASRDAALIVLLLDTGLRVGELCRLRRKDVCLESGSILVNPHNSGLKSRGRPVYSGKTTRKYLWSYMYARPAAQPNDYLFTTDDCKQLNKDSARGILRRIAERAGVQGVHPHRFRHTFAVQYLRNGGDVFTRQRLLGHGDLEMTKRYVALANDDSANVHRVASPADRWAL